jgi:hypothetical protein
MEKDAESAPLQDQRGRSPDPSNSIVGPIIAFAQAKKQSHSTPTGLTLVPLLMGNYESPTYPIRFYGDIQSF